MSKNYNLFLAAKRDVRPGCLGTLFLLLIPVSIGWLWWLQQEQEEAAPAPRPAPPRPAPSPAPRRSAKADDLTRISGIGPKVRSLLAENAITTFDDLVQTPVARLEAILNEAGLAMIDPATWPEQARRLGSGGR